MRDNLPVLSWLERWFIDFLIDLLSTVTQRLDNRPYKFIISYTCRGTTVAYQSEIKTSKVFEYTVPSSTFTLVLCRVSNSVTSSPLYELIPSRP